MKKEVSGWISEDLNGSVVLRKAARISEVALRSCWMRLLREADSAE